MNLLNQAQKRITVYAPKDQGQVLAEWVFAEFGIKRFNFSHARGESMHDKPLKSSVFHEKDVFQVIVNADQAEEVFNALYFKLQLDERPGSFIFQEDLIQVSSTAVEPDATAKP